MSLKWLVDALARGSLSTIFLLKPEKNVDAEADVLLKVLDMTSPVFS